MGTVVTTLADEGLRVRSQPRISDDSYRKEPLLPLETELVVLDGPVAASGYTWYEIVPLTSRVLPSGWVAVASRDGEPWIGDATEFRCPGRPTTLAELVALPRGVGPACFSGEPITVRARLVDCNCDVDPGGWFDPDWFSWPGEALLVDPSQDRAPDDSSDWYGLYLDPNGTYPNPLPIGRYLGDTRWSRAPLVDVTGIFNHPAAASCTSEFIPPDDAVTATTECKLRFAATEVEVVAP